MVILRALSLINYEKALRQIKAVSLPMVALAFGLGFLLASALSVYLSFKLMPATDVNALATPDTQNGFNPLASVGTKPSLTQDQIDQILKRNIFNSKGTLGDSSDSLEKKKGDATQLVKSNLPLKLLGVIFGGSPSNGLAVIEDSAKNRVDSFLVGDTIVDRVKLAEVYPEQIIVDNDGAREYIDIIRVPLVRSTRKKSSGGGAVPGRDGGDGGAMGAPAVVTGPPTDSFREEGFERKAANITISDSFKRNLLGPQMSKVLQDAKAVPNMVGGELKGFRLERIREDSIYSKSGLQNGDVVEEINGVPLRDAAGAIRLLQSIRNEKEMEVRVNRNGAVFSLNLNIQ